MPVTVNALENWDDFLAHKSIADAMKLAENFDSGDFPGSSNITSDSASRPPVHGAANTSLMSSPSARTSDKPTKSLEEGELPDSDSDDEDPATASLMKFQASRRVRFYISPSEESAERPTSKEPPAREPLSNFGYVPKQPGYTDDADEIGSSYALWSSRILATSTPRSSFISDRPFSPFGSVDYADECGDVSFSRNGEEHGWMENRFPSFLSLAS